ncbi:MAG TPA: hypothetical protein VF897_09005, partial [Roseiflexaceae bacterium]
ARPTESTASRRCRGEAVAPVDRAASIYHRGLKIADDSIDERNCFAPTGVTVARRRSSWCDDTDAKPMGRMADHIAGVVM